MSDNKKVKESSKEAPVEHICITDDQLKAMIKDTVNDTLTKLGIQNAEPIEMQKDFQLLREWRKSTDSVKQKGILMLFTFIVMGVAGAAWLGFKTIMSTPI
jgi:hypothetical protein